MSEPTTVPSSSSTGPSSSPPKNGKTNGSAPNLLGPNALRHDQSKGDKVDRTPPSSLDAEKGVLSCLMQNPDTELLGEAIEKLPGPDCFYLPAHQQIYEIILEHSNDNKPIDLVPLVQTLSDRQILDQVGGAAAVAELFNFSPTSAHFNYYLEIVLKKFTLRRIILSCTECMGRAYDDQENVDSLLDEVEQRILAIRESKDTRQFASMKDEVMKTIAIIDEWYQNKGATTGLSTGFNNIDKKCNGLHGGEMIVIAARPSMGKTALVLNILEHACIEEGHPVAFFSLEMPTNQLILRLLCSRAGMEMSKLSGGFLNQKRDFPKLMQAASQLAASPFFIDDSPALSILELRAKSRRLKNQHDLKLIAIDYLQLLRSTSRRAQDNRQLEIAEISSGIKALAKELDVPIIVLSQLNRGPESRGGKPRLSDLRESGSIEQDADMVGLLLREKYYAEEDKKEEVAGKAALDIAKNRNGPVGVAALTFMDKTMRFVDGQESDEDE